MSQDRAVKVRFHPPPEDLRRYFTTFYITEIDTGTGPPLRDALQPEWANLRFADRPGLEVRLLDGTRLTATFVATGPTTLPLHFAIPTSRMWGIGLLPLGWARFVGTDAAQSANVCVDGNDHPAFARFEALARVLFEGAADEAAELERIVAYFRTVEAHATPDEGRIQAIHAAIIDPYLTSVQQLVERAGTSQRTVERLCRRQFGFTPKLLLRRQRFMRSLAQFMLDPSLKWIDAIDNQYHDQAQFVRDFHEFMGMAPREYAAMPHPVLSHFMHERMRVHGAPVQTMDRPDGTVVRAL